MILITIFLHVCYCEGNLVTRVKIKQHQGAHYSKIHAITAISLIFAHAYANHIANVRWWDSRLTCLKSQLCLAELFTATSWQ